MTVDEKPSSPEWDDDDLPEWTDDQWDRAALYDGDKLIRAARGTLTKPDPSDLPSESSK